MQTRATYAQRCCRLLAATAHPTGTSPCCHTGHSCPIPSGSRGVQCPGRAALNGIHGVPEGEAARTARHQQRALPVARRALCPHTSIRPSDGRCTTAWRSAAPVHPPSSSYQPPAPPQAAAAQRRATPPAAAAPRVQAGRHAGTNNSRSNPMYVYTQLHGAAVMARALLGSGLGSGRPAALKGAARTQVPHAHTQVRCMAGQCACMGAEGLHPHIQAKTRSHT